MTSSDYLSLQNITFGYTLPKNLTRKLQIEGVRLYFVADNVALLTDQAALMAPTEVLAEQHYQNFVKLLSPLGITVALLTGSTKAKEKREIKAPVPLVRFRF